MLVMLVWSLEIDSITLGRRACHTLLLLVFLCTRMSSRAYYYETAPLRALLEHYEGL